MAYDISHIPKLHALCKWKHMLFLLADPVKYCATILNKLAALSMMYAPQCPVCPELYIIMYHP